jgi:hypothetical protein
MLGGVLTAVLAWLLTGWMSRRVRSDRAAWLGAAGAVGCVIGILPAALLALPGSDVAGQTAAP